MSIFIGGMFKSGTSLFRKLLGAHPHIYSGLETNWFRLDPFYHSNKTNIHLADPIIKQWSNFFSISQSSVRDIVLTAFSSEEALLYLMRHLTGASESITWCDKSPPNIVHYKRIIDYWPTSYIIHIIRDPRDVYSSLVQAKKWDNPSEFFNRWKDVFIDYKNYSMYSRYIEIRYEELILNTEQTMTNCLHQLGLPFSDQVIFHKPSSFEYNLVREITGHESTTLRRLSDPMTPSRIGIWHKTLDENKLQILLDYASSLGLQDEYQMCLWN